MGTQAKNVNRRINDRIRVRWAPSLTRAIFEIGRATREDVLGKEPPHD